MLLPLLVVERLLLLLIVPAAAGAAGSMLCCAGSWRLQASDILWAWAGAQPQGCAELPTCLSQCGGISMRAARPEDKHNQLQHGTTAARGPAAESVMITAEQWQEQYKARKTTQSQLSIVL